MVHTSQRRRRRLRCGRRRSRERESCERAGWAGAEESDGGGRRHPARCQDGEDDPGVHGRHALRAARDQPVPGSVVPLRGGRAGRCADLLRARREAGHRLRRRQARHPVARQLLLPAAAASGGPPTHPLLLIVSSLSRFKAQGYDLSFLRPSC
jgi:hypothetical protein